MPLHISLPQELKHKVDEKVRSGEYQSVDEVVCEALHDYFSKPTEEQILSVFTKNRIQEIQDSGEPFVEADLSELKEIRRTIDKKYSTVQNAK